MLKTTTNNYRVSINKTNQTIARTVTINPQVGGSTNLLRSLNDVDISDGLQDNETLVYDETSDKFIVKALPIINGGTF